MSPASTAPHRLRPVPILAGLILLAAYFSLAGFVPFRAELGKAFYYVSWREALFWLAHYSLATPGLLLVAYGAAGPLGTLLRRCYELFHGATPGHWRIAGGFFFLLLTGLALAGRHHLLLDLPITDDESAVVFGARMVAEGRLAVPLPEPSAAFPLLFVFLRDGMVSSMDFPGAIFFAAANLMLGAGALLYALLVGVSGLAMAYAGKLVDGRRGALVAALLWLFSPMVGTLSLTTHAHLLSRSFLALAMAAYCRLVLLPEGGTRRGLWGTLLGLAAGAAFLCRPIEAAILLTPAGIHLLILAARRRLDRRPVVAAVLAWGSCALLFAAYNHQITGTWYLPARFAAGASSHTRQILSVWERLGVNLGFNVGMLSIYFLGPLGVVLAALGAKRRSALATVLASAVALHLLLTLAHDDIGIHVVGPIHYSETAVPLLLLAVLGAGPALARLGELGVGAASRAALAGGCLAALGLFTSVHALTLRDQAEILATPLRPLEGITERPAVVIADPPHLLWKRRPEEMRVGSWMVQFPHPDPFLRDEVLLVYPAVDPRELVRRFPDRTFYRMTYRGEGEEAVVLERFRWVGERNPDGGG